MSYSTPQGYPPPPPPSFGPPPSTMGSIDSVLRDMCSRLARMEQKLEKLDSIEHKLGKIETRVSELDKRVNVLDAKSDSASKDIKYLSDEVRKLDVSTKDLRGYKDKILDIEKSCEFLSQNEDTVGELKDKFKLMEELKQRVIDNESRSMRDNLLFFGIGEEEFSGNGMKISFGNVEENMISNEAISGASRNVTQLEDCAETILNFCEQKLDMKDARDKIKIERAHRIGKKIQNKIRPIVAKFSHFPMREEIRQRSSKLEGAKYGIGQQYPKEVQDRRNELIPIMKSEREKGNNAFLTADKLVVYGKVWRDGTSKRSK